jgi:hypothetical protein
MEKPPFADDFTIKTLNKEIIPASHICYQRVIHTHIYIYTYVYPGIHYASMNYSSPLEMELFSHWRRPLLVGELARTQV